MSVMKLGDQLGSLLHKKHLKANGFKKKGRTFFRDQGLYVEYFNIQGSSWNCGEEPWHFYINVMVSLKVSELEYKFHADGRLESIIPDAPAAYDLFASNMEAHSIEVAAHILAASAAIPSLLGPIKARAARGLKSPLPVPASWDQREPM